MDMKEAMSERHMVRKYLDKEIPPEIVEKLNSRIAENNSKYGLDIQLQLNDSSAFSPIVKLILAKGVRNFLIMAGDDNTELDEKLGYSGADLMLYAQILGLNTWWVGGTFNRKLMTEIAAGKKVVGVIAVGYGQNQGVPHKTKDQTDVSSFEGEKPEWFIDGVKAALLAPTALAKQAFFIKGSEHKVELTCNNGVFTGVDKGLVKYHFELGAGKENFKWA